VQLDEYKKKRDFAKTGEPEGGDGGKADPQGPIFVVQKHDATRLHYDFRLEAGGTLKSWAIPKGPSSDPSVKRLAVPTEDHPMDYADFEGVIPEGEYGGGTVMVWDTGTYEILPHKEGEEPPSPEEAFEHGGMKIRLHGQKMKGGWAIFNMKGKKEWLLVKKKDEHAGSGDTLIKDHPDSALTGKSLAEISKG
jgi:DNA ligase D-like protein (predicted 3'-phosphoesterase)